MGSNNHPKFTGIVIGAAALVAGVLPSWGAAPQDHYPLFSWDKIPLYAHLGKSSGDFTDEEASFLAARFNFITIEKRQAVETRGSTEEGVYFAARQLKKLNPEMKVLFYWNGFLDYAGYKAHETIAGHPEWYLRDQSGDLAVKKDRWRKYDLSNPACREWWTDVVKEAVTSAPIDGVFLDAVPQITAAGGKKAWGAEKYDAVQKGLIELMQLTRRKMGADKVLFYNGIRDGRLGQYLDEADGAMIEHFGYFASAGKEAMAADMKAMTDAGGQGKIIVFKAWPGFAFSDDAMMSKPHEELAKLARARITFPLACFLAAAQEYSYFCYTWGYRENHGAFDWYPEFDKPLGPPKGPAKRDGWTYRREFEHASVWADLANRKASIDWR